MAARVRDLQAQEVASVAVQQHGELLVPSFPSPPARIGRTDVTPPAAGGQGRFNRHPRLLS